MKRQHEITQFSSVELNNTEKNCNYRKEFVENWLSNLPMHDVKKCFKPTSFTPPEQQSPLSSPTPFIKSPKFINEEQRELSTLYNMKLLQTILHEMDSNETDNEIQATSVLEINEAVESVCLPFNEEETEEKQDISDEWLPLELNEKWPMRTLVEYPNGTVPYGANFREFPLSMEFKVGTQIDIQVCEMLKPFKFWFISLKMHKSFSNVMKQMKFYNASVIADELIMNSAHIFAGMPCAVLTGDSWSRGIISDYLMGTYIKVFLVDFGVEVSVKTKYLRYLKTELFYLPQQVIRGQLAYIMGTENSNTSEAKKFFNRTLCCRKLRVNIVRIQSTTQRSVLHCDLEIIKTDENNDKKKADS